MEATLLLRLFPDLNDSFDKDELPISFIIAKDSGRLTKGKAASAEKGCQTAARKAVSQRMKKYWAGKRKARGVARSARIHFIPSHPSVAHGAEWVRTRSRSKVDDQHRDRTDDHRHRRFDPDHLVLQPHA